MQLVGVSSANSNPGAGEHKGHFLGNYYPERPVLTSSLDWTVREVRDGRVLLDRPGRHVELDPFFKETVVCDPLHRQYLLLPPIPGDVAALVAVQLLIERGGFADCFLVPSGDDEEADATEETSFRVIWLVVLENKPVALVFSSHTGQWRAITPLVWSLPGLQLSTWKYWFVSHHYAHGCIYWISGSIEKLLVLDIRRMEFSMVDHPPCARHLGDDVAIAEAGQGRTLMFVPKPDTKRLIYTVWWRNNGGNSTQWQMEKTISLDFDCLIEGAVGSHLLLYYVGVSSAKQGCYTQDVDTLQLERMCYSCPKQSEVYCNFPPSLLSSPTVSSVPRHADHPGVDDVVSAPEPREADPGGVEGHTGQELRDVAGVPPCKHGRRSGRSGSRTRGGGFRWTGRRRLRLDPWWTRAWGRMRGQIKVLSRTAAAKALGGS
uniref:F-box protein AT5G49610-like beta-propeller domain-containing protein n=1 Tax=Aegilops tauschii TaxID=37682 RepID=M8C0Z0_AEGTA